MIKHLVLIYKSECCCCYSLDISLSVLDKSDLRIIKDSLCFILSRYRLYIVEEHGEGNS